MRQEFVKERPILWKKVVARTIDLSTMMENKDSSYNTKLYEVPVSTQLSMERLKIDKSKNGSNHSL